MILFFLVVPTYGQIPEATVVPTIPTNGFNQFDQLVFQVTTKADKNNSVSSSGTAFVVKKQGLLATNFHVVSEMFKEGKASTKYKIYININKVDYEATIADIDIIHDLAILKVPITFENEVILSSEPLKKGQKIYAIGFHDKEYMSINQGTFNGYLKTESRMMAVSVAVNPGMSGGPILNENFEVVGVNCIKNSNKESSAYGVEIGNLVKLFIERGIPDRDSLSKVLEQQINLSIKKINGALSEKHPVQFLGSWVVSNLDNILECGEYKDAENLDRDKDDINHDQINIHTKVCSLDYRKVPLSALDSRINVDFWLSNVSASANTSPLTYYNYINRKFNFRSIRDSLFDDENYKCEKRNIRNSSGVHLRVSICAWKYRSIPSYFKSKDLYYFDVKAFTLTKKMDDMLLRMNFSSDKTISAQIITQLLNNLQKGFE